MVSSLINVVEVSDSDLPVILILRKIWISKYVCIFVNIFFWILRNKAIQFQLSLVFFLEFAVFLYKFSDIHKVSEISIFTVVQCTLSRLHKWFVWEHCEVKPRQSKLGLCSLHVKNGPKIGSQNYTVHWLDRICAALSFDFLKHFYSFR